MSVEFPGVDNVGHAEKVQLLLARPTCDVDREQDREGNETSDKARDDGYLQESQEEIRVKALMLKNEAVGNLPHLPNPREQAIAEGWRVATRLECLRSGTRGIFPGGLGT